MGGDRYWLLHTSLKVSVKAPLLTMVHTLCHCHCTSQPLFPSVPLELTPENKKLFCDFHNHCKESPQRWCPIMLMQLSLNRSLDFWRICNSVLDRGKSTIPPILKPQRSWQHLLTKLPPLLRIFHAIPPLIPNSFPIFHLVLNRDLALRISLPKSTILMHPKPLAQTEFQPLSLTIIVRQ